MPANECVFVTYIATTPEKLWDALTRGELTRRYWYDRRIQSEWIPGSPVSFYDGASDILTDGGSVLESDPPRHLSYTFRVEFDPDMRARGYSRVSFTLEPHEVMVKLTLVHDELPDAQAAVTSLKDGRRSSLHSRPSSRREDRFLD